MIRACEPFEVLHCDTVGPFPADKHGNKYVHAAVCGTLHFVEAEASPTNSAEDFARFLVKVCSRYGPPKVIRGDNGGEYISTLVRDLEQQLGIDWQPTLAYRPQANGVIERCNQEINRHLRTLAMQLHKRDNWSELLPLALRIINAQPHATTGVSPTELLYGNRVTPDRGLFRDTKPAKVQTVHDYVTDLATAQDELLAAAQLHSAKVHEARLRRANTESTPVYAPGDYVLLAYPGRAPTKLSPRWYGPMIVVDREGDNHYKCQDLTNKKMKTYHLERLKYFNAPEDMDLSEVLSLDDDEHVISHIVDHALHPDDDDLPDNYNFRVSWLGYGPEEDTWHFWPDVRSTEAMEAYLADHPQLCRKHRPFRLHHKKGSVE